jgi:hypothetical protein
LNRRQRGHHPASADHAAPLCTTSAAVAIRRVDAQVTGIWIAASPRKTTTGAATFSSFPVALVLALALDPCRARPTRTTKMTAEDDGVTGVVRSRSESGAGRRYTARDLRVELARRARLLPRRPFRFTFALLFVAFALVSRTRSSPARTPCRARDPNSSPLLCQFRAERDSWLCPPPIDVVSESS